MTLALLDRGARVTAVEIDPVLTRQLPKTVAEHSHSEINRLTVLNRDILTLQRPELADEPTLACIKESSDNPRRITDIINLTGDRYVIFAGVDDLFLECLLLGAVG